MRVFHILSYIVRLCPLMFVTIARRLECKTRFSMSCSKFWNDKWRLREDLEAQAMRDASKHRAACQGLEAMWC